MRFGRDTQYILGGVYCNTHIHETGYQIPGKRILKKPKTGWERCKLFSFANWLK